MDKPVPEFDLFTSLRYDLRLLAFPWNSLDGYPPSPFFHLPYHYSRLLQAAKQFEWPVALHTLTTQVKPIDFLKSLCQECVDRREDPGEPLRIRITLSKNGDVKAQGFPTLPLEHDLLYASTFNPDSPSAFCPPSRQLKVYLDTKPTPQSVYTSYKTTARDHYDAARARLGILSAAPEEVLLYNLEDEVTEGSVRNVAFWRNGLWVTPGLDSGCLAGTVRRWLLENERIIEGKILREEVIEGEWVLLCNGVEGCLLGIICKR